jgi:hypothetical protein
VHPPDDAAQLAGRPPNRRGLRQYNTVRLRRASTLAVHSGIGYVTPQARLEGRDQQIIAARRSKLAAARQARETAHSQPCQAQPKHEAPVTVVPWQNGVVLRLTLNH